MPDKKYLIEIPGMPEGSGVWDADKWERNKDLLMEDYPEANVFELGEYDPEDAQETDQIMLDLGNEDMSGVWDNAKWERNKELLMEDYPEAKVSRVRYVDYWGQKADENRAQRAQLQQPNEERNAKLAELGYYDDITGGQVDFSFGAPSTIGLKPLSSAVEESLTGETVYHDPRVKEFFANDTAETDRQAEIARLDAEYEQNPSVIAQREWEAKMLEERKAYAGKLEEEIRANMESDVDMTKAARGGAAKRGFDPMESEQMSYLLDRVAGDEAGSGAAENEKLENYNTALKFMEKAKIARDVAGKGFGGAVVDWAKEGVMDLATQDDIEAYNEIGNILSRLEKKVGSLKSENLTEEVFDKYLTKDEQALIKSFYEYNSAMAEAGQNMSRAYKGGKIFAESVPFMLEFLITGGVYKSAGRAATSWMGKGFAKWIAKSAAKSVARTAKVATTKIVSGAVKAGVGTLARTAVAPGTYDRMAEASINIDDDGHLNRAKESAIAFADMYVENLSEISGGLIGKGLGLLGKGAAKAIAKTPLSKVGTMLADNAFMQSLSKFGSGVKAFLPKLEALGFHGLPEEIGEEFIGNTIREVAGIQPGALKEMVSDDNFGAMLIGFAPMTMLGVAGGVYNLGVVNAKAAQLGKDLREKLSSAYTEEELDHMMGVIQNAQTAEDIQKALKPMAMAAVNSFEKGEITKEQMTEQIEMLYQYGGFMAQNNALLFGKKAQDRQMMDAKREEFTGQYGRFWQEDQSETVQIATLNNGSTVFVTSTPAEDGKITTIDVTTGKKGFANVSDIATQEVEGEQVQSSNSMTMDAFLNGQIATQRKTAEETRMNNERDAQIQALAAQITPGTRINLGTEGSPVIVFAKRTNKNGVVIVDETGMESLLGWEQAAYALGQPIKVETDQQKLDAEISERLQRMAERRMQRAVTPASQATVEAAEGAAEAVAQEQQNIPLNEDGTVNEALFWTQDPEGYVKWNDEQNKDGGQDSLRQIAISKQELFGMLQEVAAGQNTSNPTMRKAAEKQVAAIAEKIARLEALEMSYADALAEEKEAVKQTAATPTATMNEEQLEQMDAQYQGILGKTRIQSERVRVMQEYLNKISEESFPVVVLTRANYAEKMKAEGCEDSRIKIVERYVKLGKSIGGFTSNGKLFLMEEGLPNINEARVTYVHERQHVLNTQNPKFVQAIVEAAGGNREMLVEWVKSFVGNEMDAYKSLTSEGLADELICRCMEIAYTSEEFSVDLQSKGIPSEVISIITEIDNEQRSSTSLANARRRGRRNENANVNIEGGVEENGRDIEQISGGILGNEAVGSSGSSNGRTSVGSTGEGAEVISEEQHNVPFRIVGDSEEVNPAFVEAISTDVDEAEYAQFLDDKAFADPQPVDGIQPDDVRFSIVLEDKMRDNTQAYFDKHYNGGKLGKKDQKLVPLNVTHFTQVLLDAANAQIEEMRKYMLPYLDMESKGKRFLPAEVYGKSTLFDNSSYGKTMENTLICTRTLAYIDFVEEVKKRIGRPLTATESFLASQMLYDIAVDPQCLYCYVSLDRKAYDEFLLRYIQQRDEVISKWNASDKSAEAKDALYKEFLAGRKPTSQMQARFESWLLLSEGDNAITPADLATKARRGDLKISEAPEAWEKARSKYQKLKGDKKLAYAASEEYQTALWNYLASPLGQVTDAEAYAQSASWAKKEEDYRSYTGELLNCTADALKGLMGHYGLRFYSFSEYSPAFILENMQMVRDAAARGLKGFAYTKEIDFIKIFAPTGMNINCSVYGRVDSEGNVVPDIKQGADWAQVQALREQYPNVGAVFVATNDEMVEWALNQPWIDVIIPFHIVRTGADIAKFYEWTNYSSMQADTAPSGKTTYIFPHEHHNDKTTFLNIAQERGLSPRFADVKLADGRSIVEHPNYMRLVNETRRSVDETPILTPTFNVDAAKESFDAFVAKGGYYSGYFYEDEAFEQGIETVVEDIKAGKTAKDVDYGRQDVPFDVAKIMAKRAEMERKHGKSGVIDLVEEAKKAVAREEAKGNVSFRITPEMKEIKKQAEKDGTLMKAPNGQPTNLTEEQWLMVRTQNFKNWFGDWENDPENASKVVDENGEPKVVFHQTNQKIYVNRETGEIWDELGWKEKMEWDERDDWEDYWEEQDFNTFSRVNARTTNEFDGFFFAPEYDEYHEYGDRTIAAFVNIKNPASREDYNIDSRYNDAGRNERIRLQEAGFDGVIRMDGDNVDEYIAFEPNQIKSATDNNGDFNPNNNDIRFRITPEQDKAYMDAVEAGDMQTAQRMVLEAAKLAMPNTKVVDEDGNPKVVYHGTGSEFYTFRDTSDSNELGAGYYFSDSYEMAERYATDETLADNRFRAEAMAFDIFTEEMGHSEEDYDDNEFIDDYNESYAQAVERLFGNGHVKSVFLNLENPRIMSRNSESFDPTYKYGYNHYNEGAMAKRFNDGIIDEMFEERHEGLTGTQYVAFNPSQIKSADPVTYDDKGNVIPLSERFNPESSDIRFRIANENQATFVSNAAKAVEGIKMEKATPEQWLKMIEKNGGLKAGEDKWMGLSDWLKASDKKTLTKAEVLDFINEHMIQIEEVHYAAGAEDDAENTYAMIERILQEKFGNYIAEYYEQNNGEDDDLYGGDSYEYAMDKLREEMNDEFPYTIERSNSVVYLTFPYEETDDLQEWADKLGIKFAPQNPINSTRLDYTTDGLNNKHEIALTVPTIESWNDRDEVHFGDAGDGRAVAWIRFGDTEVTVERSENTLELQKQYDKAAERFEKASTENFNLSKESDKAWKESGEFSWTDSRMPEEWQERKREVVAELREARMELDRLAMALRNKEGDVVKKVLVIDEIQSKRHQEGRDKGYKTKDYWPLRTAYLEKKTVYESLYDEMANKYGEEFTDAPNEEFAKRVLDTVDYESIMKAKAEFDAASDAYIPMRNAVPEAPFDKNWHELAMKRMLRYAAENGYDVIAWTKGDQQADRYNLGKIYNEIEREDNPNIEGRTFSFSGGNYDKVTVNEDGVVVDSTIEEAKGKPLSDLVGKDLAVKMMSLENYDTIDGEELRIGGEGMKGFYDRMLPAFMNKYGKKWGVKVEDIELPGLENGLTMHSVPVTEEMKASVMEGQVMFRVRQEDETPMEFEQSVLDDFKKEFNLPAPTTVVDVNDRDALAAALGYTPEEFTNEMYNDILAGYEQGGFAFYERDTKRIAIFAREELRNGIMVNNIIFHENTHYLEDENPEILELGEWLWQNSEPELRRKIKEAILESGMYEGEEAYEMLAAYTGYVMSQGKADVAYAKTPSELQKHWELIFKAFGYEPREKEIRRRGTGDNSGRVGPFWNRRNAEAEMPTQRSDIQDLTAEERRIIGEYFPEFNKSEEEVMKAPNGKDSKLTKDQWNLVRSEEFIDWFGDWINDLENASKVIDPETGEPMVVYHGTAGIINEFQDQQRSPGFWFVDREDVANGYAESASAEFGEEKNVIPVFLNIRNPRIEDAHAEYPAEFALKSYVENDNGVYVEFDTYEQAEAYRKENVPDGWVGASKVGDQHDLVEWARERGNDGVIIKNAYDQAANAETEVSGTQTNYVVLRGNQIKLASNESPTEGSGIRFRTSLELDEEFGDAWRNQQNEDGRHSTQVANTKSTYEKIGHYLEDAGMKGASILDASSGLGLGTQALREMGFQVDDVEPFPSENREAPTFSSYADIDGKYDVVISNAVLNVIPDDWRADVLHQMADAVKEGGKMIINTRPASNIAQQGVEGKTRITLDSPSEILVKRGDRIAAYQKGFTSEELAEWIKTELGEGWRVEKATKKNSGISGEGTAVVIKEGDNVSFRTTGTPTDEVVAKGVDLTPSQTSEVAANIFAALPEESRKKITDGLNGNILGLKDAILQIPTSLASKENWNDEDRAIAAVVREVVQDLVDANPTTRPLTTKEALWMLYDSTKEVKDLVDAASRAFVAYNLGFDPASMQRKQEVNDYIRFRTASNGAIDAATDMYNYETSLWTERLKESWLDMNQSVISLQKAMAEASGMPIEPWENLEFALNRLSSKSLADKKKYLRDFLIPMWDTILDIVKHDHVSIEEIERYMMLKHGLERNKKFASRDAKEFYRAMYDLVAERMKNQSHAQQVVALSEAKKRLADIDAQIAVASSSQLPRLNEARAKAQYDVDVADLVLRGDEQQNEAELQAYYDAIDNEVDPKYREFREKDYGGLTSMFVDTTEVKRSQYKSEEAYQRAVLAATAPKFDNVADMEAEAEKEVDAFESKVYVYRSLWDSVNAATKETLRHQYESGMITLEQYEAVRDMFEYYIPLRGFADNTAEDMYSYYMNNSAGGFTKPILGAKGRKTRAESPLGWIGTMAESAIQADNKNEAKMCLYYMAQRRPDQGLLTITETWYEYTGQKENGKKIFKAVYPPATDRALNADELRQHMEDWEDDMRKKQSRGEAYKSSQKVDLKGSVIFQDEKEEKEHAVRVKVAGKDYSILINGNPRAAQAINGLLNPDANVGPVAQWIGDARRNLSALLTSYSPLFWVANFQRDLLSSTMRVSEADGWDAAMKYLTNRRKAWRVVSYIYKYDAGTLGNSYYENLYKEFAENGGITGYTSLTTNKEYENLLEKYAKNADREVLNAVKGAFDKFMGFGEAIEQVSRFAAFITAREEGKSIEEAINAAKEISVNFNRKGSAKPISLDELDKLRTKDGKKLNKAQRAAALILSAMPGPMKFCYYFVNASIQALSSSAKLAKKSPGKATTWVGMYMGTSIALAMLNYLLSDDDDDEYLNLPDYLRHSTALIKVTDGYYFKWSIPQEMRPFYAWADILVRKMMGKMPHKDGKEVGKEMALAASQWLPVNPFDAEDPLLSVIPDFLSPLAEIRTNTNAFGGKIYDDMAFKSEGVVKEIPAYRKATEKTGTVYVDIAEFLNDISGGDEVIKGKININPSIMEHLIEGYGGGIYDFAKMMVSIPSMILSDDPVQIKEIPFVNKVILSVAETNMYSHTNEAFRHYKNVADNAKRVEKEYRESDDPSRADAYREEEDWRIYLLYKEYEKDFKDVKERLDNAVDKEEQDLLKQEQNVLREMFLDDIAKGDIPEITFQIREDVKRLDKEIKAVMKPVTEANKERLERRRAGDVEGMLKAIERRDSLKNTLEYRRAEDLNGDLKKIKQQIKELGSVTRGAQRDSVIGEIQKNYDALIQKMEQL